jgi:Leucine-rich repeat (LRR) protein
MVCVPVPVFIPDSVGTAGVAIIIPFLTKQLSMSQSRLFEELPRDVAALLCSLLRFEDLRSLVRASRALRRSPFREEWLHKTRLTVPPSDAVAARMMEAMDDVAASSITNVVLVESSHLAIVSRKLSATLASLRISNDGYMANSYEPIAVLPQLDRFQRLRRLDLSGSAILGVASLAGLTHLTELDVSLTVVVDLSPLHKLTRLQVLNLERTRVKSISVVRAMPELRVLNLNGTQSLKSLTPIACLKKLTALSINDKDLVELDSLLAVAPTLTTLDAIDVSFLGERVAPPVRHSALSSLVRLQHLRTWPMSWTQSLEPLHTIENLRALDIRFPPFSDLAPLQYLTDLEELQLMIFAARDTAPLGELTKLRRLVVTGCPNNPRALDFVDRLPVLSHLSLSGEIHFSVVARLGHLDALELNFSGASWGAFPQNDRLPPSMWTALTSVKKLSLRFPVGDPADLSGLVAVKQLEVLDLRYATPKDLPTPTYFDFLRSLKNLRELRLACGGMEDLTVLQSLSKLEFLDLTSTNVANIEPLAGLRRLQQIELAYTRVTDVSPLATLEQLRRVVLPIEASCLPLVRADLPHLRTILHEHRDCLWNATHHRVYEERECEIDADAVPVVSDALDDLAVAFGEFTGDY